MPDRESFEAVKEAHRNHGRMNGTGACSWVRRGEEHCDAWLLADLAHLADDLLAELLTECGPEVSTRWVVSHIRGALARPSEQVPELVERPDGRLVPRGHICYNEPCYDSHPVVQRV